MKETKKSKTRAILKQVGQKTKQHLVVAELLEHLMAVWGGPAAFSAAFHTTFSEAKEGSLVRARMLSDIMNLFKVHTASIKATGSTVEGMSDAELKAVLEDLVDGNPDCEEPELL